MPGGRPPKLEKEDKIQAYAYHIAGFSVWEIAKKFNCSDRTIHKTLDWVRERIPQYNQTQNLFDAIHATREMIKDLNFRKRQILGQTEQGFPETESFEEQDGKDTANKKGGKIHWNVYIGIMRQLRECHVLLHKLQGIQKMTLDVGEDTFKGLWDIMQGTYKKESP